ncbi:centrosome-associated protein CEP250-like [Chamaea fasciata]|uniref:centrosome-associated protein CEP250-like n=1 Tax=Chamaea fasciata TaxID=190680 RepID=UPI00336A4B1A
MWALTAEERFAFSRPPFLFLSGKAEQKSSTAAAEPPLARSPSPEAKGEAKDIKPPHVVCAGPEHPEPASPGELSASQDSSAKAGEAEWQERTERERRAQELRWKQLAALKRKRHSSLERVFEISTETAEESQPLRDLLKEEVPLAVPKVCHPQQPAHRDLERLLQEFSRQGHTLSQVYREKVALAQEKAALEARLAATEQDLRGLSEQLVEARSEKESLQSSLLEAQWHVSELEMTRSHLEGQACTATWAKELILEDVRALRRELLALRSLNMQQHEEMARQICWTEEHCIKALQLLQCAQEEEKRKLQEKLMDAGSAAAAAPSEEASAPQPENLSTSSSARSSQEREKQCLELLGRVVSVEDPEEKYTGWKTIGSGAYGTVYEAFDAAMGLAPHSKRWSEDPSSASRPSSRTETETPKRDFKISTQEFWPG